MIFKVFIWSGRKDLNLRPLAPHASTLPDCATPRIGACMIAVSYINDKVLKGFDRVKDASW